MMRVSTHSFLAYFAAILLGLGIGAVWDAVVEKKELDKNCDTALSEKDIRDNNISITIPASFVRQFSIAGGGKNIRDDPVALPAILARQLAVVEVDAESASSATGGRVFKMKHTRTYQGGRLDSSKRRETFPPPEASEMCERWAVITSIFEPTDAVRELAATEGWCVVVVGDKNGELLVTKTFSLTL